MAAHLLPCTDETTHVGLFDNSLAPILTIDSGDTVVFEIGTLMANRIEEGMAIEDLRRLRDSLNIPPGIRTWTSPPRRRCAT